MIFLNAWIAMLLAGAAHSLDERVPAIGYWTTVVLILVIDFLRGNVFTSKSA